MAGGRGTKSNGLFHRFTQSRSYPHGRTVSYTHWYFTRLNLIHSLFTFWESSSIVFCTFTKYLLTFLVYTVRWDTKKVVWSNANQKKEGMWGLELVLSLHPDLSFTKSIIFRSLVSILSLEKWE